MLIRHYMRRGLILQCFLWLAYCHGMASDASACEPLAGRFRNNEAERVTHPLRTVLRWQWQRWRAQLPPPAEHAPPTSVPDLARLHA